MTNQITLPKPIQGIINIPNLQGNYRKIALKFDHVDPPFPFDLEQMEPVIEIKEATNVKLKPFLRFTLGDGIEIINGNVLVFTLEKSFFKSQSQKWVADLLLKFPDGEYYTFVKFNIGADNVVTGPLPQTN